MQRRHHLQNYHLTIRLNGRERQQHKVIGVVVDENLQWCGHDNVVFKKVSQTMSLFRRSKHSLDQWSIIMFYDAYNNERYNERWYSPDGASAVVVIRFGNFTSSTLQITNFVGYG